MIHLDAPLRAQPTLEFWQRNAAQNNLLVPVFEMKHLL